MIWLTWRQFRAAAAVLFAALAAFTIFMGATGSGLADDYSGGLASCTGQSCSDFVEHFYHHHQAVFLAVTAVVLVLPALVGLFWGAPLVTRELEAGTHRLVWNQSITRTRWLAVKLGLVGVASIAAAALGSLVVTWYSNPIDKSASGSGFPRMGPLIFDARGIAPIGYAAFAFALGVTAGMVVRRTFPAMAVTLAVFAAVQVVMPLLIRPHLESPVTTTVAITQSNVDDLGVLRGSNGMQVTLKSQAPGDAGAWVLSSRVVDSSGKQVDGALPVPTGCATAAAAHQGPSNCLNAIKKAGYRQQVTYQPSNRFWPFQWYETGVYAGLAALLTGISFWWIRRRIS